MATSEQAITLEWILLQENRRNYITWLFDTFGVNEFTVGAMFNFSPSEDHIRNLPDDAPFQLYSTGLTERVKRATYKLTELGIHTVLDIKFGNRKKTARTEVLGFGFESGIPYATFSDPTRRLSRGKIAREPSGGDGWNEYLHDD